MFAKNCFCPIQEKLSVHNIIMNLETTRIEIGGSDGSGWDG